MYRYGYGYNFARKSGSNIVVVPNPSEIFGTDLYDWWDITDNTTLTLSGSRIDAVDSKASGSTRQLTSSGANRPQIVTGAVNGLQVANFDGVSEFMSVPSSTALYNFLHNQSSGGAVFIVGRLSSSPPTTQIIITNGDFSSLVGFYIRTLNDSGKIDSFIFKGSSGNVVAKSDINRTINQFSFLQSIHNQNSGILSEKLVLKLDGNTGSINTFNNIPANSNAFGNLTIGKLVSSSNFYLKGDIAEIIITTGQPTTLQLTQVQSYLTNKYGTFPII